MRSHDTIIKEKIKKVCTWRELDLAHYRVHHLIWEGLVWSGLDFADQRKAPTKEPAITLMKV